MLPTIFLWCEFYLPALIPDIFLSVFYMSQPGAVSGKAGRVIYLNIIQKVVPLCDCASWSDIPVVPDIGFLASTDPVAIDQASFDLVKAAAVWPGSMLDGKAAAGDDKFTAMHPNTRSELQMEHGQEIGLGSREYELVRL
jgi:uncharacterized Fe-S center protein